MHRTIFLAALGILMLNSAAYAQQAADLEYRPPVEHPAYEQGKGPVVGIDEAHHNFHTASGRYQPFAELLTRDGYRMTGFQSTFTAEALAEVAVLVIANPLNERNVADWSLPTPSAFTKAEIAAVRQWVEQGGSLLLIADHMPFPGAAGELAQSFGVTFSNGYAQDGAWEPGQPNTFVSGQGVIECSVTLGRDQRERVTEIATFGGSAFTLPQGAIPILKFGPGSWSHETTKAPGISADAKQVSVDDWYQGGLLSVGKGRVAVFGEAAMFTAQRFGANQTPMGMNAPEAAQNHQLLLNVMHWLTRVDGMPE